VSDTFVQKISRRISICPEFRPFVSIWTYLNIFGHIWTYLDIFGHIWTYLDIFMMSGQSGYLWTRKFRYPDKTRVWTCLVSPQMSGHQNLTLLTQQRRLRKGQAHSGSSPAMIHDSVAWHNKSYFLRLLFLTTVASETLLLAIKNNRYKYRRFLPPKENIGLNGLEDSLILRLCHILNGRPRKTWIMMKIEAIRHAYCSSLH
jgi:hypothetical protein